MLDPTPPQPLSKAEIDAARAAFSSGTPPDLGIIRRFIATIRKNFLSSPSAVVKGKTTRNKKPPPKSEDQIDFF